MCVRATLRLTYLADAGRRRRFPLRSPGPRRAPRDKEIAIQALGTMGIADEEGGMQKLEVSLERAQKRA